MKADIDRSSMGRFKVKNGQGHFKLNTASLQVLRIVCLTLKFRLNWLEMCNLTLQLAWLSAQNGK